MITCCYVGAHTPLQPSFRHYRTNVVCTRRPLSTGNVRMSAADSEQVAMPERDWRQVRAALHFGSEAAFKEAAEKCYRPGHWAHPLSKPETGCFLASHPALFRPDTPYLTQAVIFLLEHSPTKGSTGLVLNRPLAGKLSDMTKDGSLRTVPLSDEALKIHGNEPVYLGGQALYEASTLIVLEETDVHKSRVWESPRPGLQVASLETAYAGRTGIEADPPTSDAVRIFAGCVKWGAGKLDNEVEGGEWFVCSASTKYATEHCIRLPKPLWREIMESSGELFARIARKTYGEDE